MNSSGFTLILLRIFATNICYFLSVLSQYQLGDHSTIARNMGVQWRSIQRGRAMEAGSGVRSRWDKTLMDITSQRWSVFLFVLMAFWAITADVRAQVTCFGQPATIVGTEGDDVIVGLGGNDIILGLGGNDRLCGGAGNDYLDGGKGNDQVDGGEGDDLLLGRGGHNHLEGGPGDDQLEADNGNDLLLGSPGNDILQGNTAMIPWKARVAPTSCMGCRQRHAGRG
jgi:Ca2+-binding RTX toxin-like protein